MSEHENHTQPPINFADFFWQHRVSAGMPDIELMVGNLANKGLRISSSTYRNWLHGSARPWPGSDEAIAAAFDVSSSQIDAMRSESSRQPYPLSRIDRDHLIGALALDIQRGEPLTAQQQDQIAHLFEQPAQETEH
jgi:transcriptional regulator with XRE-family HTH domain